MPMTNLLKQILGRFEADVIASALATARWNRKKAARDLGISYRSMLLKIKQYELDPYRKGDPESEIGSAPTHNTGTDS